MLLTLVIVTTYLVSKLPNRELFVFGVFGVFVAFSVLFVMDVQQLIKGDERKVIFFHFLHT